MWVCGCVCTKCVTVFMEALFIVVKTRNQWLCPSGVEELSLYTHNETLQSREDMGLSERSWTQRSPHCVARSHVTQKRAGRPAGLSPAFRAEAGGLTGRECEEDSGCCWMLFVGPASWLPGLIWWLIGKESACQCRRHRFDPWVSKIPWRRNSLVFSPGKSHGQRSLVGCSP